MLAVIWQYVGSHNPDLHKYPFVGKQHIWQIAQVWHLCVEKVHIIHLWQWHMFMKYPTVFWVAPSGGIVAMLNIYMTSTPRLHSKALLRLLYCRRNYTSFFPVLYMPQIPFLPLWNNFLFSSGISGIAFQCEIENSFSLPQFADLCINKQDMPICHHHWAVCFRSLSVGPSYGSNFCVQ